MAYVRKNEMTAEEWLAQRKSYLGASETPAILGFDKYMTPLDVYLDKRGETEPSPAGVRAEAGLRAEEMIASWISDLYSLKIQRDNKIRCHPKLPFWRCNLDRLIVGQPNGTAALELKTTSMETLKRWDPKAEELNPVFVHHWIQVQAQLAITGYKWAAIGVMPADSYQGFGQPELIPIQPDQEFITMMAGRVEEFWEGHVLSGVPPAPMTEGDLKALYPRSLPKTLEIDEGTLEKVRQIAEMRKRIKGLGDELDEMELALKLLLTDYEAASYQGEVVCTYKSAKERESFNETTFTTLYPKEALVWVKVVTDVDFIKSTHPEIYQKCLDRKPGARSLIPKIKL